MRSIIKKITGIALTIALVAGFVPAAALADNQIEQVASVGPAEVVTIADGSTGEAGTSVYVDVVSGFKLLGMSGGDARYVSGEGAQGAIEAADGALWATVTGWAGTVMAQWVVNGTEYAASPASGQGDDFDGRFFLPLSLDGTEGSLRVDCPGYYVCEFSATDSSKKTVSGTVYLEAIEPGEADAYVTKTVYKDHEQTEGLMPTTFAEPSAAGRIHELVVDLSAIPVDEASQPGAWNDLVMLATNNVGEGGSCSLISAWSLAMIPDRSTADEVAPYRGELSVVLPLPSDADLAVGDRLSIVGYDENGAKASFSCAVQAAADGQLYVQFSTADSAGLGVFGIAKRNAEAAAAVKVIAETQGAGFINYEGERVWARNSTVRYIFTPVEGWRLAGVTTDSEFLTAPDTVALLGYWDVDLSALPDTIDEVHLVATYERIPESGDGPGGEDPTAKHTLTVEIDRANGAGPGTVQVNGVAAPSGATFSVSKDDVVELSFTPTAPSQSIEGAWVSIAGGEMLPLGVYDGNAVLRNIADDAVVIVRFSAEIPVPALSHRVTLSVVGAQEGHGSIDTEWSEGASTTEVSRVVADGAAASFNLFPQMGYGVYTVTEGNIELGSYLNRVGGSGLQLRLPDIHRDHQIAVTFKKSENMPDIVPKAEYVTIQVESGVVVGSKSAIPAIVTPESVIVPQGTGYSFYVIPGNDRGALESVEVKGANDLTWQDITERVAENWIEWPEQPAGATSTGYYALKVEDVHQDTFIRVLFRDRTDDDPKHDPTPTRKVTIAVKNEDGASGTVSPNTMGKDPLLVPMGATVQVVVICEDGSWGYVDRVAPTRAYLTAEEGDVRAQVDLTQNDERDASSGDGERPDGALGDGDIFEIPDDSDDQDFTFIFRPANKPGSSSSSSSASSSASSSSSGSSSSGGASSSQGSGSGNSSSSSQGSNQGDALVFTVTPKVIAGSDGKVHGSVSPAVPVRVHRGDNATFSFAAEVGYRVQLQVGSRTLIGNAGSSYTLENIQADTELTICFVQRTVEDSLSGTDRVIHRLQSLAKTGDIMLPVIIGLMGVAFAAAGVAVLAASRRRKRAKDAA